MQTLAPGAVIGILGGGQLGRMTALAAAALGYRCHVYCPENDAPACEVAARTTRAAYDDAAALAAFAAAIDVATLEFENIPTETVARIAATTPVYPGADALAVAQDRIAEKRFLNRIGIETARFAEVTSAAALGRAAGEIGLPAILKTARFGYDGKGQQSLSPDADLDLAWTALGGARAIIEARIPFEREISVVIARNARGDVAAYDTVENEHEDGILRTTRAPARIDDAVCEAAQTIARRIADALSYVGVLAVEMFVGGDGAVLVNEIAPRPHNSGHWTIDACAVSQFEQVVRAVCGLPLGHTRRHSDAVMTNILGDEADGWRAILQDPSARLHLYGKDEAKPGRKMGHVTRLRRLSEPEP